MAEENLGEIYVKIKADVSNLEKEMEQIRRKVSKDGDEIKRKLTFKAKFDNSIAVFRISELQKLREKLQREFDKKVSINVSSSSLDRTREKIAAVDARLKGVGESAQKTGGIFSSAFGKGLIMAGGITAFFGALKNSILAAQESAIAQAKIAQAVRTTGMAAGLTAKELFGLAEELKNLTAIDDDTILTDVTNNLLTFKNVSGDVFKRAQVAIFDLNAVISKGEIGALTSQTIQLGKALNDPIQGVSALTRVGISFNEEQKEQIKSLTESGRLFEAQSIILKEIEGQYGGQAKILALADGGFKKLNQSIDDISEAIGKDLVGSATEGTGALQELADGFLGVNEAIKEVNGGVGIFGAVLDGLKNVVTGGRGILDTAFNVKGMYKAAKDQYIKDMKEATKRTKEFYSTLGLNVEPVKITPLTPQYDTTFGDQILANYQQQKTEIAQLRNKLQDVNLTTEERITLEKELSSLIGKKENKEARNSVQTILGRLVDIRDEYKLIQNTLRTGNLSLTERVALVDRELQLRKELNDLYLKAPEIRPVENADLTSLNGKLKIGVDSEEVKPVEPIENPLPKEKVQPTLDMIMDSGYEFEDSMVRALNSANEMGSVLNISADTFIGKILAGLNQAVSIANSILGIIGAFTNIGSGGIFGLIGGLFAHSGGEFLGTSTGIKKLAGGGDFIVPPGFPNDSYPMLVESGERVTVTPAGKAGSGGLSSGDVERIVDSIQAMNMNLIKKNMSVNINANLDSLRFTEKEVNPNQKKLINNNQKS